MRNKILNSKHVQCGGGGWWGECSMRAFLGEEPQRKACAILAPHPGMEPLPPAVEAWSLNQWTTREVLFPTLYVLIFKNWLCYFQASWYIFSRYVTVLTVLSCSVMSDSLQPYGLQPTRLLYPWDCPSKITGVDCHFLLRGPSPPGIVHTSTAYPALQQILYHWATRGAIPSQIWAY